MTPTQEEVELMGEALFLLSNRLLATNALEDAKLAERYENVVSAWSRLTATIPAEPTADEIEAVARAIGGTRQDAPNDDYGLRMGLSWDEQTRAAVNALAAMPSRAPSEVREALEDARKAIASLDEYALGGVDVPDFYTGEIVGQYGIRDELLSKIDAALSAIGEK